MRLNGRREFESMRRDLGHVAQEVLKMMKHSDDGALEKVKDRVQHIRETVEDVRAELGTRLKHRRDELADQAEELVGTLDEQIQERPLAILAIAAGIGFIAGAALRR